MSLYILKGIRCRARCNPVRWHRSRRSPQKSRGGPGAGHYRWSICSRGAPVYHIHRPVKPAARVPRGYRYMCERGYAAASAHNRAIGRRPTHPPPAPRLNHGRDENSGGRDGRSVSHARNDENNGTRSRNRGCIRRSSYRNRNRHGDDNRLPAPFPWQPTGCRRLS